jgi:nucleoside transporter
MSRKMRLGIMMFLQYAIWGSWAPALSEYMSNTLGLNGVQIGAMYSLLPLATIIAPFFGGQLADRYVSTEKLIAFLQFTGGILLIVMSRIESYGALMALMFAYCLLYAPTFALTNSIAMINLDDTERDFGPVRVGGTLGWIAAGLGLSAWRFTALSTTGDIFAGDMLLLAGIVSLFMGVQSLSLPHTPPQKDGVNPWAFLEALKMLKDKNFAILIAIAFIVSTELQFYYILTAPFLVSDAVGVSQQSVTAVMTLAQFAEIFVMAFMLPVFMKRYGIRTTMVIGIIAWPVRYIIFAIGDPNWLVISSLTLHGFCYVFFFTASMVYVDKAAPRDIRASAQSMIALVTLGFGNLVGSFFTGWISDYFTVDGITNWRGVFIVPTVLTMLAALLMFFFRDTARRSSVTE